MKKRIHDLHVNNDKDLLTETAYRIKISIHKCYIFALFLFTSSQKIYIFYFTLYLSILPFSNLAI